MSKTHTTKAGTELPLISLKGKDYLEVKYRLVWFREEHPDWSIETQFISITDQSALAKATISNEAGRIVSTSHKFEDKKGFFDFMEKAETGSIGRALALIGYGTQFCADELDEGERIVDAPAQIPHKSNVSEIGSAKPKNEAASLIAGSFVIPAGPFATKKLSELNRDQMHDLITGLQGMKELGKKGVETLQKALDYQAMTK